MGIVVGDILFHSVAQEFGLTAVGVLMDWRWAMTARKVSARSKAAGGMTIAQSEDTCVVERDAAGGDS